MDEQARVKKPLWKRWWVWVIVILLLIGALGESNTQDTNTPVNQDNMQTTDTQLPKREAVPGSLDMTLEVFQQRFNDAAAGVDANFSINNLEIEKGEVQDSFHTMLTDNIGLLGTVNKADGTVRDVMIMGQGDGSLQSGVDIIIAIGTIIATVHPEFTPEKRGQVLTDLGLFDENMDITNLDSDTVRGQYKYWINSSPAIGIMFGVKDKDDN